LKQVYYKLDLIYPQLSYQIVGILFDIFINLGPSHKEIQYKKAIEIALKEVNISYQREVPCKLFYKGKFVAIMYLDFLIEEKIVLEIKQGDRFYKKDIEQVYNYLKSTGLKLGILARFTKSGVKFKRVVNIK